MALPRENGSLIKSIGKGLFWASFAFVLEAVGILLPAEPRSPFVLHAVRDACTVFGATYLVSIAIFLLHTPRTDPGGWLLATLIWAVPLGAMPFLFVEWRWYLPAVVVHAWDAWIAWESPNLMWLLAAAWALCATIGVLIKLRDLLRRTRV